MGLWHCMQVGAIGSMWYYVTHLHHINNPALSLIAIEAAAVSLLFCPAQIRSAPYKENVRSRRIEKHTAPLA